MKNISHIVEKRQCLSCGLCCSICPVQAISMKYNPNKGLYQAAVDEQKCINCSKCQVNCPSGFVGSSNSLGESRFQALVHSADSSVRYDGTSGGVINSLASFLIEERMVEAVLMVGRDEKSPIESSAIVITKDNVDDLAAHPREYASRYVVVPVLENLTKIVEQYKTVAVVGTPCQIRAVKRASKTVFALGLTCSGGMSYIGTAHYKKISDREESSIYYRGNGWPGKNSLVGERPTIEAQHSGSYFEKMFSSQIFKNPACRDCTDHFAELADISFCDYWATDEMAHEKIGNSCVIVRSEKGKILFDSAVKAGRIIVQQDLSREEVINTQLRALKIKKTDIKNSISYRGFYFFADAVFRLKLYKLFNYKIFSKICWMYTKIADRARLPNMVEK